MKKLLIALICMAGATAQADIVKSIQCIDPNVQDANFAAKFVRQDSATGLRARVSLSVPTGETSARVYRGSCRAGAAIAGRPTANLVCMVATSSDSGYKVELFDNGRAFTKAVVTTLRTRGGPAPEVVAVLPVCKVK